MAASISRSKFTTNFISNFVVALAAFWVNLFLLGVLRSNAVIYTALLDKFGINRQYAAWPAGLFGFFMSITGAVSGFLTHYFSIRNLAVCGAALASLSVILCSLVSQMQLIVFFYGALQGIGVGLVVPLTHVILNQSFIKYRALALGIAYSGSSAGSFIFPPFSNYLLDIYGLDGTFLVLGGIMLNSMIGAMLFRIRKRKKLQCKDQEVTVQEPDPKQEDRALHAEKGKTFVSFSCSEEKLQCRSCQKLCEMPTVVLALDILTNPLFIIISIAYASYFTSSAVFLMVILDFAKDRGVKMAEGVFLISAFSFGDLTGRLAFGWIADLQLVRRGNLVRLYLLMMGILIAVFPLLPNNCMLPAAVVLGVINGGVIVNHSVLFSECLGLQKLPLAMGFSTCIVGLSAFLRPVIIGIFRDYRQSYDQLFLFLGLAQACVVAVWFLEIIIPFVRQTFFANKQM